MTTPFPTPPTWVRKRDGRLVPFEADKISRALFAVGESCGRPDAFLARELADVVVHFLADETEGKAPTTEQVAEVVVKVLRELKQRDLAAAFEEHARRKVPTRAGENRPEARSAERRAESGERGAESALREHALKAVFTRDLAAAHRDEVLCLGGLEAPGALASCLLGPPVSQDTGKRSRTGRSRAQPWPGLLEELADFPAQVVVVEGPEHALARSTPGHRSRATQSWIERMASCFVYELGLGLRLSGRSAVLSLNGAPPPWADETEAGPLFATQEEPADVEGLATLADVLAEVALQSSTATPRLRIDWHLSERDFQSASRERLLRLARAVLVGGAVSFTFDRPRRPPVLAEGVQRRHPAVLLTVGLHLPRLATLVLEELPLARRSDSNPAGFPTTVRLREKLKSLGRLALSAALQKREFLRRHSRECPALARGFLLERARLLVVPLGLDRAVQLLRGHALCSGEDALDLGREMMRGLLGLLREEGRASALEVAIDSSAEVACSAALAAGPTCWDTAAPVRAQLHAMGELHEAAEGGTGVAFLPADPMPTAEEVAGWLRWAWKETRTVRLRLARAIPPHRQLTFSPPDDH